MTTSSPIGLPFWSDERFWLWVLLVAVAAFHLYNVWNILHDADVLTIHALFWATVLNLIWERRHTLKTESSWDAVGCGLLIIVLVLLKATANYNLITQIAPWLSLGAVTLIASGWRGIPQYFKELGVLFILISSTIVETLLAPSLGNLALWTAKLSNLFLIYGGFEVIRQGTMISLPTGSIDVYEGCSGFESMLQVFRLSILFLVLFPVSRLKAVFAPVVGVLVAFVINGIRVALMALLVAGGDGTSFRYWHEGEGSNIFSIITMLLFGLFCRFLLTERVEKNVSEES